MGLFITGIILILFGIIVGMISIGIYLVIRGTLVSKERKAQDNSATYIKHKRFESTRKGKLFLGIFLLIIGIITSTIIIGIPLVLIGGYLIILSVFKK
jgi:hypothetical protein